MDGIVSEFREYRKVAIITAIITTIGNIAVAYVGVFPQLREADSNTIKYLEKNVDSLKTVLSEVLYTGERWRITGTVVEDSISQRPISNAEIYLIRADGKEAIGKTGDSGRFIFDNIDPGAYWLILRNMDTESKRSGRELIDTLYNSIDVTGAHIRYKITQIQKQGFSIK